MQRRWRLTAIVAVACAIPGIAFAAPSGGLDEIAKLLAVSLAAGAHVAAIGAIAKRLGRRPYRWAALQLLATSSAWASSFFDPTSALAFVAGSVQIAPTLFLALLPPPAPSST